MGTNNKKLCIGIDVSKSTLDIYCQNKSYKITNDSKSVSEFIQSKIDLKQDLFCVMESTGGYEKVAAKEFKKSGIPVHIAHPNKVHSFAKATDHFTKTDKLDAILLHKYAEFISEKEKGTTLVNDSQECLLALRRLASAIEDNLHAAQCRLKQVPKFCIKYLQAEIKMYKKQIIAIQKDMDTRINGDKELKSKQNLMVTMKGIGNKAASTLLAELPELGTISPKKIARLVGLAPKTYQSGTKSTKGHISGGRFYARKTLYMSALVASRHDINVKKRYKELQERGKPKKVALVAIMRDMIVTLNAMIRDSCEYSTSYKTA